MKRILFVLPLLLTALPAAAYDEHAMLKDYAGLTKVLASYGIDAATINWGPIEPLCLPLKTVEDQTTYNECKLEKAINLVGYNNDTGACQNESIALYPNSLQHNSEIVIEHHDSEDKTDTTTVTQTPPLYTSDLKAARAYVFDRCMKDHGWRAAHDWRLGMDH